MKHDTYSINKFKQILSRYNGKTFIYNHMNYKIIDERLFYNNGERCFWYCMPIDFTNEIERILYELFRNTN